MKALIRIVTTFVQTGAITGGIEMPLQCGNKTMPDSPTRKDGMIKEEDVQAKTAPRCTKEKLT